MLHSNNDFIKHIFLIAILVKAIKFAAKKQAKIFKNIYKLKKKENTYLKCKVKSWSTINHFFIFKISKLFANKDQIKHKSLDYKDFFFSVATKNNLENACKST